MMVVDHGALTGYISMNCHWAGYDSEDYYRASSIAMDLIDGKLDLAQEYLPESGRRLRATLVDDHGISKIAREYTKAEMEVKEELEGRTAAEQEYEEKEHVINAFQLIDGDLFSNMLDPVVRIGRSTIAFNSSCVAKMDCGFVEILFNPVERMIVVRPCREDHPNAMKWGAKSMGATALVKVFYDSLGWDREYTYRIRCQTIREPNGNRVVLGFDLDDSIGRAINKKEEVIIARKAAEVLQEKREEAKSFYYPPDEDEPQEIKKMEERFQKIKEQKTKIFGEPLFGTNESARGFESVGNSKDGEWDMLAEAKPVDIAHRVDEGEMEELFQSIVEDPPELPEEQYEEEIELPATDEDE